MTWNEEAQLVPTITESSAPPVLAGSRNSTAWIPTFGEIPGLEGFLSDGLALAVFDDGSGPALYVGGSFARAGNVWAEGVARWDGTAWSSVGSATGNGRSFAVFDDGSGEKLYALGVGSGAISSWDGSGWLPLGTGLAGGFGAQMTGREQRCSWAVRS